MARVTWPLLYDRPLVRVVLRPVSGQPVLLDLFACHRVGLMPRFVEPDFAVHALEVRFVVVVWVGHRGSSIGKRRGIEERRRVARRHGEARGRG